MRRVLCCIACSAGLSSVAIYSIQAAPFVPRDDTEILERVPASVQIRSLQPLRARLAAQPDDVSSALELATAYLQLGRDNGDPRFTSYAEATLARWMAQAVIPAQVLVLQATALQSLHRFPQALALLDLATAAQPNNAQAWLAKATILQVLGRFTEARPACGHLVQSADQLIAMVCLSNINALTGRLAASYQVLNTVFRDDQRLPLELRVWVATLQGEMAERLNETVAAERHLRRALSLAPMDLYAKAALADLWLSQQRNDAVIELLADNEQQDNLLLRLAIAGHRAHSRDAGRWASMLEERYEAAQRRLDSTHLREQAIFALWIKSDPATSLQLARQNWDIQKEPADLRIYLQAAVAAKEKSQLELIKHWLETAHYEDRQANALLDQQRLEASR